MFFFGLIQEIRRDAHLLFAAQCRVPTRTALLAVSVPGAVLSLDEKRSFGYSCGLNVTDIDGPTFWDRFSLDSRYIKRFQLFVGALVQQQRGFSGCIFLRRQAGTLLEVPRHLLPKTLWTISTLELEAFLCKCSWRASVLIPVAISPL